MGDWGWRTEGVDGRREKGSRTGLENLRGTIDQDIELESFTVHHLLSLKSNKLNYS